MTIFDQLKALSKKTVASLSKGIEPLDLEKSDIFSKEEEEKVKFNEVLRKNQNIKDILGIIKNTNFIAAYEITDKKITIK